MRELVNDEALWVSGGLAFSDDPYSLQASNGPNNGGSGNGSSGWRGALLGFLANEVAGQAYQATRAAVLQANRVVSDAVVRHFRDNPNGGSSTDGNTSGIGTSRNPNAFGP